MMKRIGSAALALTLAASLAPAALAAEDIVPISAPLSGNPNAYASVITINGEKLSTLGVPAANASLVPMRLVAEADYGSASWYEDENTGSFYMNKNYISVDFNTGAVTVNDEVAEDVTAVVTDGVTFLPVTVLTQFEGYSVILNDDTDGVEEISISTPNGAPMMKLARQIMADGACYANFQQSAEEMETYSNLTAANFEQVVGFFPMMTSPDTMILGKVKEGQMDAVKEELEAYRQIQLGTFEWYLSQNLPKVENAQVVTEGDYILFLIAENAEGAVETFRSGVAGLTAE